MYPVINILGRSIGTYAIIALVGAFLCGTIFCRMIYKRGYNDNDAIAFLLFVALGVVIGSHLLYAIVNYRYFFALFSASTINEFVENIILLFGGSVFYGGLIGAIVAGMITIKVMGLPREIYVDCMAPIVPLFHGIARIGCFFAGCCYGIESQWGFASEYNPFVPEVIGVSRFPVQLLESLGNFLIAAFLFSLLATKTKKKPLQGKLIYLYFLCYSILRFFDEFLRGDSARGYIGILTVSQTISLFFFVISLYMMFRRKECNDADNFQ